MIEAGSNDVGPGRGRHVGYERGGHEPHIGYVGQQARMDDRWLIELAPQPIPGGLYRGLRGRSPKKP